MASFMRQMSSFILPPHLPKKPTKTSLIHQFAPSVVTFLIQVSNDTSLLEREMSRSVEKEMKEKLEFLEKQDHK